MIFLNADNLYYFFKILKTYKTFCINTIRLLQVSETGRHVFRQGSGDSAHDGESCSVRGEDTAVPAAGQPGGQHVHALRVRRPPLIPRQVR